MPKLSIEELPYFPDSFSLFSKLKDLTDPVWLDSGAPYSSAGRYDIISAEPETTIKRLNSIAYDDNLKYFKELKSAITEYTPTPDNAKDLPFTGGVIGYLSYDIARDLERLPETALADIAIPSAYFGVYRWGIINDHLQKKTLLVAHPLADKTLIRDILGRLKSKQADKQNPFTLTSEIQSNLEFSDYQKAFQQVQQYIHSGDCYQINLTQRFSARYQGDPLSAYKALRKTAGAPFSAFMQLGDSTIMSLSPERFIQLDGNQVLTSPIKGTIHRSDNPAEDIALGQQLLDSPKDRAENLMIVDLLRNDLGKRCKPGSIKVDKLFELQSFKTVHHLVSTISGELEDNADALDLLAACFPGGSITGAPKVRAMEIIDSLEPHRRSIYCGAMGYISSNGNMDTNITIRTLLCESGNVHCWSGGGIVADSDCEAEYQESLLKVEKLLNVLKA
jgi:para-aminobenzoate synthetase component 1